MRHDMEDVLLYDGGAEILHIETEAPGLSSDVVNYSSFRKWWQGEIDMARKDGLALVVLDCPCDCSSCELEFCAPAILGRKWLEKIEEEDFYSNDDAALRVRFTNYGNLIDAMSHCKFNRKPLEDVWGDCIERGNCQKISNLKGPSRARGRPRSRWSPSWRQKTLEEVWG